MNIEFFGVKKVQISSYKWSFKKYSKRSKNILSNKPHCHIGSILPPAGQPDFDREFWLSPEDELSYQIHCY